MGDPMSVHTQILLQDHQAFRGEGQPYTPDEPHATTVGLGCVHGRQWTISATDTEKLRELASALLKAANDADAITAELAP